MNDEELKKLLNNLTPKRILGTGSCFKHGIYFMGKLNDRCPKCSEELENGKLK